MIFIDIFQGVKFPEVPLILPPFLALPSSLPPLAFLPPSLPPSIITPFLTHTFPCSISFSASSLSQHKKFESKGAPILRPS